VYLDKIGSEVADRETNRHTLRLAKRDIISALTSRAEDIRADWEAFDRGIKSSSELLPEMPRTLFEAMYEDVTAKTKSIALSAVFGPSYEANMRFVEDEIRSRGGDVEKLRALNRRVMAATDPDEFS
jgi:hypothetical protein